MLDRNQRLAIYMEGALEQGIGKMGFGVLRYSPNPIACVIDSHRAGRDAAEVTGIPRSAPVVATVEEARDLGAEVLVLGIAPPGGLIPAEWYPDLDKAVALGMSLVNGLHDLLGPRYPKLKPGQWIWDIRVEPSGIGVATGAARKLKNRRLLMVGIDMAIGKMTAGLEIHRVARERGVKAEFIATGQIGITVTGRGVPLDAVRVDFACGAMEKEVLNVADADLIVIEGQGALSHPGSTATLPLMRGTMPTHLIMCHQAGATHLRKLPEIELPPLPGYIRLYEDLAEVGGTFPRPRTAGISLITAHLSRQEAEAEIGRLEDELGIPVTDVLRFGPEKLVDSVLSGA
jgi:uncharacterized NAD-dependent epimerase/dehydratase family protein